ncbi:DUF5685 family protein [uncultured Clostridium sp.]|uniref:DUF5685 family protein n=1 Tax=uncultured Clostridium sp. TaxID=59620 RepID=UPI002633B2D0|nr:DUF5685 family protein [uncultured Clostridium sp.]
MFGYVTPLKPELKIREYNQFRAYYCGLCLSIKKQFGNIPRLALNYDMTFLSLFLDGLIPEKEQGELLRCFVHPVKKKPTAVNNPAVDYAANMNVSLFYYKLLDDVNDEKSLKSKTSVLFLSPYQKRFSSKINVINKKIETSLKELSALEKNLSFQSLDDISHPFAEIVGNILMMYPNTLRDDSFDLREDLYSFGYALGKWIYLIDAFDDLEDDIEKKKFNPINILFNKDNLTYNELIEQIKDRLEFNIINCACTCREYFYKLPLKRNNDIIKNIIELGMMDRFVKILNKKKNCCTKKGSEFNNESI